MGKHYKIRLNFLGKDSVTYDNVIEVPEEIWNQFNQLIKSTGSGLLFPNGTSGDVKNFLDKIQKGITPKNLRTVVCNETLVKNLKQHSVTKASKESEKIKAIFEANLEIAKTLNHQKNVSKGYKEAETKSKERVQKTKDRLKVVKAQYKDRMAKLEAKADKFRVALKGQKLLKEKLAEIEEAKAKLVSQTEKAKANIERAEFALDKKQLTKDVALGTSLANYADPKVIYSYLKFIDLDPSKIFTASVRKVFDPLAQDIDEDYWRNYPV
jgi:DNA topoisomerase-1